jgi:hypothetical protein
MYVSLKDNKMPKRELTNGLRIGITPKILPKLTMVEETLIACYCSHTILVKLIYTPIKGAQHVNMHSKETL